MREETQQKWLFWVRLGTRTLGALSIICGALIKLQGTNPKLFGNYEFISNNPDLLVFVFAGLLVIVPIGEAVRRWLERKTLWPLVKSLLEDFRGRIYPDSKDPAFHHRITLFRQSSWVFRLRVIKEHCFGWVYIIERTGHTTLNSRTIFRACNEPEKSEGIAGTTWAANKLIYAEHLPDLGHAPTAQDFERYAKETNTPLEEIKRRNPLSRSLCGIPIEVRGKVWGTLVIDSRSPNLPKKLIENHYPLVAKSLGRLLERLT